MKTKEYIKKLEQEIEKQKGKIAERKRLEEIKVIARDYDGDTKVVPSHELVEIIKNRPDEEKMMSGIDGLDKILDGFRRKQLIILSALSGVGKTTFALELTDRMRKYNPLFLSYEQTADELIQGFIERQDDVPLFFTPLKITDNSKEWIENKVIEGIAKWDSQVVFIDHLHYIIPFTTRRHDLAVGDMVRFLKQLANKWNIVIFLISHLRKVELEKRPTISDLKDSSAIGQECDTLIMLSREVRDGLMSNDTLLSVQKNRKKGKLGVVKLSFTGGKFYEFNWQEPEKKGFK